MNYQTALMWAAAEGHLETVEGNVSKLAKKVGLERTHLYRKLKNLNINAKDAK